MNILTFSRASAPACVSVNGFDGPYGAIALCEADPTVFEVKAIQDWLVRTRLFDLEAASILVDTSQGEKTFEVNAMFEAFRPDAEPHSAKMAFQTLMEIVEKLDAVAILLVKEAGELSHVAVRLIETSASKLEDYFVNLRMVFDQRIATRERIDVSWGDNTLIQVVDRDAVQA